MSGSTVHGIYFEIRADLRLLCIPDHKEPDVVFLHVDPLGRRVSYYTKSVKAVQFQDTVFGVPFDNVTAVDASASVPEQFTLKFVGEGVLRGKLIQLTHTLVGSSRERDALVLLFQALVYANQRFKDSVQKMPPSNAVDLFVLRYWQYPQVRSIMDSIVKKEKGMFSSTERRLVLTPYGVLMLKDHNSKVPVHVFPILHTELKAQSTRAIEFNILPVRDATHAKVWGLTGYKAVFKFESTQVRDQWLDAFTKASQALSHTQFVSPESIYQDALTGNTKGTRPVPAATTANSPAPKPIRQIALPTTTGPIAPAVPVAPAAKPVAAVPVSAPQRPYAPALPPKMSIAGAPPVSNASPAPAEPASAHKRMSVSHTNSPVILSPAAAPASSEGLNITTYALPTQATGGQTLRQKRMSRCAQSAPFPPTAVAARAAPLAAISETDALAVDSPPPPPPEDDTPPPPSSPTSLVAARAQGGFRPVPVPVPASAPRMTYAPPAATLTPTPAPAQPATTSTHTLPPRPAASAAPAPFFPPVHTATPDVPPPPAPSTPSLAAMHISPPVAALSVDLPPPPPEDFPPPPVPHNLPFSTSSPAPFIAPPSSLSLSTPRAGMSTPTASLFNPLSPSSGSHSSFNAAVSTPLRTPTNLPCPANCSYTNGTALYQHTPQGDVFLGIADPAVTLPFLSSKKETVFAIKPTEDCGLPPTFLLASNGVLFEIKRAQDTVEDDIVLVTTHPHQALVVDGRVYAQGGEHISFVVQGALPGSEAELQHYTPEPEVTVRKDTKLYVYLGTDEEPFGMIVVPEDNLTFADLRALITEELDDLPTQFCFLFNGAKMGLKQEAKRFLHELPENCVAIKAVKRKKPAGDTPAPTLSASPTPGAIPAPPVLDTTPAPPSLPASASTTGAPRPAAPMGLLSALTQPVKLRPVSQETKPEAKSGPNDLLAAIRGFQGKMGLRRVDEEELASSKAAAKESQQNQGIGGMFVSLKQSLANRRVAMEDEESDGEWSD